MIGSAVGLGNVWHAKHAKEIVEWSLKSQKEPLKLTIQWD